MHSPSVEKPNFGGNLLFHPLQHRSGLSNITPYLCSPLKYHTSGAAPRPITVTVGGRRPHRRRRHDHRCRRRQAVAADNAAGAAITDIAAADIVATATATAAAAVSVAASFS
jgi:hypothetical protein